MAAAPRAPRLRVEPATAANWPQLCRLFGERGACGGCWCMTMRLPARDYDAGKGAPHKRRLRRRVDREPAPGLLAFAGDEPVAWISLGPRPEFARLATSRVLAPVDDRPVWSIVCMFVRRDLRRRGVSRQLLRAAAAFARRCGADVLEGYPVDPKGSLADAFAWTGLASAYRAAGFREVARRSVSRPVFRLLLRRPGGAAARAPAAVAERGARRSAGLP
ncbi:MAG: GNAT family N-acetyltransferase [Planctomycetota bacterium]